MTVRWARSSVIKSRDSSPCIQGFEVTLCEGPSPGSGRGALGKWMWNFPENPARDSSLYFTDQQSRVADPSAHGFLSPEAPM